MTVLMMLVMTHQMHLKPKNNLDLKIWRRRIVGLVRHIGNVVYSQGYQGFESLRLRQDSGIYADTDKKSRGFAGFFMH